MSKLNRVKAAEGRELRERGGEVHLRDISKDMCSTGEWNPQLSGNDVLSQEDYQKLCDELGYAVAS